eukprot:TRINITY_DN48646_c0_g1_i1.p3 TRINITY_DN48646_c0_g1~~TRINITY_DN48646_c0_g1_i1.p3  ORF type:complete len:106 (+),score=33.87 TRINITY_DN48646_c0_g1_i1:39-356(+)
MCSFIFFFFFFSSRRRHTRCREVSWARRCVQETGGVKIQNERVGNCFLMFWSTVVVNVLTARAVAAEHALGKLLALFSLISGKQICFFPQLILTPCTLRLSLIHI